MLHGTFKCNTVQSYARTPDARTLAVSFGIWRQGWGKWMQAAAGRGRRGKVGSGRVDGGKRKERTGAATWHSEEAYMSAHRAYALCPVGPRMGHVCSLRDQNVHAS